MNNFTRTFLFVGAWLLFHTLSANSLERYPFPEHGFSMELPTDWTVAEKNFGLTSIYFIAYQLTADNHFGVFMESSGLQLPTGVSAADFANQQFRQLAADKTYTSVWQDSVQWLSAPLTSRRFVAQAETASGTVETQLFLVVHHRQAFAFKVALHGTDNAATRQTLEAVFRSFQLEPTLLRNKAFGYELRIPPNLAYTINETNSTVELTLAAEVELEPPTVLFQLLTLQNAQQESLIEMVVRDELEVNLQYNAPTKTHFGPTTDGKAVGELRYATVVEGQTKSIISYYLEQKDLVYVFTLTCPQAETAIYEQLLHEMVTSLRFTF